MGVLRRELLTINEYRRFLIICAKERNMSPVDLCRENLRGFVRACRFPRWQIRRQYWYAEAARWGEIWACLASAALDYL